MSLATISRYLPTIKTDPRSQQRWTTFLRNHRDVIAAMDFFVVPTIRFKLLYVWFAIDHGRRSVLAFDVTTSPTALWVSQRLRNAFPQSPIHRFLIYDNDAIFSSAITEEIGRLGLHPQRTAFQSPWQNGTAERFVGTVRLAPRPFGGFPRCLRYRNTPAPTAPKTAGRTGPPSTATTMTAAAMLIRSIRV